MQEVGDRMIHANPPRARCEGQSYLFESVYADDHRIARQECVNPDGTPLCPLFAHCRELVHDMQASHWGSGVHGTWAGKLYGAKNRPGRPRRDVA